MSLPLRRLPALTRPFRLLAIESSADDSCVSIVSSDRRVWSNVVVKQHLIHGASSVRLVSVVAH
jgi:N6-L-threonylcarbamoyladenine synthase